MVRVRVRARVRVAMRMQTAAPVVLHTGSASPLSSFSAASSPSLMPLMVSQLEKTATISSLLRAC